MISKFQGFRFNCAVNVTNYVLCAEETQDLGFQEADAQGEPEQLSLFSYDVMHIFSHTRAAAVKNLSNCTPVILLLFVQSLMVAKAKEELEQEILEKEEEKEKYLAERAPPLNTGSMTLSQLEVKFPQFSPVSLLLYFYTLPPLASL